MPFDGLELPTQRFIERVLALASEAHRAGRMRSAELAVQLLYATFDQVATISPSMPASRPALCG